MTTYQKSVAEVLGAKEKILRGSKDYSGGEEIVVMILSSSWDEIAKVSTVWEESKTLQKDE